MIETITDGGAIVIGITAVATIPATTLFSPLATMATLGAHPRMARRNSSFVGASNGGRQPGDGSNIVTAVLSYEERGTLVPLALDGADIHNRT